MNSQSSTDYSRLQVPDLRRRRSVSPSSSVRSGVSAESTGSSLGRRRRNDEHDEGESADRSGSVRGGSVGETGYQSTVSKPVGKGKRRAEISQPTGRVSGIVSFRDPLPDSEEAVFKDGEGGAPSQYGWKSEDSHGDETRRRRKRKGKRVLREKDMEVDSTSDHESESEGSVDSISAVTADDQKDENTLDEEDHPSFSQHISEPGSAFTTELNDVISSSGGQFEGVHDVHSGIAGTSLEEVLADLNLGNS